MGHASLAAGSPLGAYSASMQLSVLPSLCGPTKARNTVCILVVPGPWTPSPQAKYLPEREDSRGPYMCSQKYHAISGPSSAPTHKTPDEARKQARKASHSVRIGSRSWLPPASLSLRPRVVTPLQWEADPGSEISITLGTDCTATTVTTRARERSCLSAPAAAAAMCHLYCTGAVCVQ